MDKKNTVTIRLTDEQFDRLRALSRRSKRSQSEVMLTVFIVWSMSAGLSPNKFHNS